METVGGAALVIACVTAALGILKWLFDRASNRDFRRRIENLEALQRIQVDYIEQVRHWGTWANDPTPRVPPPYPPAMRTIYVPQSNTES